MQGMGNSVYALMNEGIPATEGFRGQESF